MRRLRVSFFGSSLVSAYWNGAATYYRGILSALAARGHRIEFYEPDAYDRQKHRDIADPPWASVIVYRGDSPRAAEQALAAAQGSDLVVKASGVGVFDAFLEVQVLRLRDRRTRVAFWDVDAAATLERLQREPADPFRALIPRYDAVFTCGGGQAVMKAYHDRGARRVVPLHSALDPSTHHTVAADERFAGDLGLLANRQPDREARIDEYFFAVAERLPHRRFVLGGGGWESKPLPANVRYMGHVYTCDHNAFNCSTRLALNVHHERTARMGHAPATRVFEAAGAGACIISDVFAGVERFLSPESEILLADDGAEVARLLEDLSEGACQRIGNAARTRVLAQHTYDHRADTLEAALAALWPVSLDLEEPARNEPDGDRTA
jgi:spore maturation protein CgeB